VIGSLTAETAVPETVTPYDLRHTATSLIAAWGQSAERLADLLGHMDTRMVFRHCRHPVTSSVTTAAEYWKQAEEESARDATRGAQRFARRGQGLGAAEQG
jgi:integrase